MAIYCWTYSLSLRVVCFPDETPLEKIKFSFEDGYQLEISSGLGMGTCAHFFQLKEPICYRLLWNFFISVSVSPHVLHFCWLIDPCVLVVLHTLSLLDSMTPFCLVSWNLGEIFEETSHLGQSFQKFLTLYMMFGCGSPYLF